MMEPALFVGLNLIKEKNNGSTNWIDTWIDGWVLSRAQSS